MWFINYLFFRINIIIKRGWYLRRWVWITAHFILCVKFTFHILFGFFYLPNASLGGLLRKHRWGNLHLLFFYNKWTVYWGIYHRLISFFLHLTLSLLHFKLFLFIFFSNFPIFCQSLLLDLLNFNHQLINLSIFRISPINNLLGVFELERRHLYLFKSILLSIFLNAFEHAGCMSVIIFLYNCVVSLAP